MMTWRLWRALQSPPYRNPLFQRAIRPRPQVYQVYLDRILVIGFVAMLGGICFFSSIVLPLVFIASVGLIVFPLLGVLFSGTVLGTLWAHEISSIISGEHERGTYNLLCLCPSGALGVNWAICTGCLYRHRALERINSTQRVIFAFLITVSVNVRESQFELALIVLYIAALTVAFHIDYVQSVVLSGLIGLYTASIVANRTDARLWTVGLFLFLQLAVYVLSWILGFVLVPGLYVVLHFEGTYADISLLAFRLVIFYAIREGVITGLWYLLLGRLNIQLPEMDLLLRRVI